MSTEATNSKVSQGNLNRAPSKKRGSLGSKKKLIKRNRSLSIGKGKNDILNQKLQQLISKHIGDAPLLCSAASTGNLQSLSATINANPSIINSMDYDKRTPLHLASAEGHLECVRYLVEKKADVNLIDRWSCTPLRSAMITGKDNVAKYLRENGAVLRIEQIQPQQKKLRRVRQTKLAKKLAAIDLLFNNLQEDGKIKREPFVSYLKKNGLVVKKSKVLLDTVNSTFGELGKEKSIDASTFTKLFFDTTPSAKILQRLATGQIAIPNWGEFCEALKQIFETVNKNEDGNIDETLPESNTINANHFAISVVTVDGQIFSFGDTNVDFSIESCGMPILYSLAIEDHGYDHVHQYVGKEPSGHGANSFTINYQNKAHNACIDSGAIVVSALFHPDKERAKKFNLLSQRISELAGSSKIGFNQSVYLSMKDRAHASFALTYFLASQKGGFPDNNVKISDALDFFFQVISLEVNCDKLAKIASSFANFGWSPLTGNRTMSFETVKRTMQLLFSCGMYDYSGEWACTVGLPAKSSRTGAIFLVVPGVLGMSIYAPRLDKNGNSVKGVDFAQKVTEKFSWNVFDQIYFLDSHLVH